MKLILSNNINRTYVQSLCMAFFHGIKFPQAEEENEDGLELIVFDQRDDDGIFLKAKLKHYDKISEKELYYELSNAESEKRSFKTAVGQVVYQACKDITGKDIDWGILTGIRPSKVCAEILCSHSEEETENILKEKYLLSTEKAKLIIEVSKNETSIMSLTNDNKCSIYISIPFCPSRCNYCSFVSYVGKKLFDLIPAYMEKLLNDIRETVCLINDLGMEISCVYIGGGTPTILTENQLERLLKTISEHIDVDSLDEFTLEGGRPDTITETKLKIAKSYGVNRISVNPQTLNDKVLEKIGRKHTVNDFLSAFDKVRDSGIRVVNTDLIAGLDGDDFESFKLTVDKIISLNPSNVTVHTLCVKKSAQLLVDDRGAYDKESDYAQKSVEYALKALTQNGYAPYYLYRQKNTVKNLENVGYAKVDSFGLYNVFMMSDAHTVFGIGAGCTTKLVKNNLKTEILRIFSPKYPYEYLRDNKKNDSKIKEFFDRR